MARGYNKGNRPYGYRHVRETRGRLSSPEYMKPKFDKTDVANGAKRKLVDTLKNVPCKECGQRFPPVCMDFHHRRPKEKRFNVSQGFSNHTIEELIDEIRKCDVVCANCHRLKRIKEVRQDANSNDDSVV
jgi:hypothetical protein